MCSRRDLKVNAEKSKVMVLGGEEELEHEVSVDGMRLEHVSEFKYLFWKNQAQMRQSAQEGDKWEEDFSATRSLVNGKDLQLDCAILT